MPKFLSAGVAAFQHFFAQRLVEFQPRKKYLCFVSSMDLSQQFHNVNMFLYVEMSHRVGKWTNTIVEI